MGVRGFTLLELVVAVTMLAVGVLAVAASAVPLGQLVRRGDAQVVSAAVAGAEIEAVRATGCSAPASGVASAGHGLRISRTVAGRGALQEMTVVATYPWGPGARSDTFRTAFACTP
ncbi:MAG TPA: type II secretion system protein [Gemmatimonadales bacterium]|nr:type II secretion system protein [Gemmatimonadales bacterium]